MMQGTPRLTARSDSSTLDNNQLTSCLFVLLSYRAEKLEKEFELSNTPQPVIQSDSFEDHTRDMRLVQKSTYPDARVCMLLFFCSTVALALGNHFYFAHLDGRKATQLNDADGMGFWVVAGGPLSTTQPMVNAIAIIFAKLVELCVTGIGAIAFMQVLGSWRLRREVLEHSDLNGAERFWVSINPRKSTVGRTLGLITVTFCVVVTHFITAFVPGSLTISNNYGPQEYVYEYFAAWLWGPYGGILWLSGVCVVYGWVARHKNVKTIEPLTILATYLQREGKSGLTTLA